jgi:hypothetical protein
MLHEMNDEEVEQSGGVIVGATITTRHEATGVETRVITNSEGAYSFSRLSVGEYTLTLVPKDSRQSGHPQYVASEFLQRQQPSFGIL